MRVLSRRAAHLAKCDRLALSNVTKARSIWPWEKSPPRSPGDPELGLSKASSPVAALVDFIELSVVFSLAVLGVRRRVRVEIRTSRSVDICKLQWP